MKYEKSRLTNSLEKSLQKYHCWGNPPLGLTDSPFKAHTCMVAAGNGHMLGTNLLCTGSCPKLRKKAVLGMFGKIVGMRLWTGTRETLDDGSNNQNEQINNKTSEKRSKSTDGLQITSQAAKGPTSPGFFATQSIGTACTAHSP